MTPTEPQVPTRWPRFLTAGATFKLDRSFVLYNNTDWAYSLILAGAAVVKFSGTPQVTPDPLDASLFHVVLAPTDTQPLNPGGATPLPYQFVERLTAASDGEIFDVNSGRVMIEANLALASAGDGVSFEEKTLAVLEAVVQGRITADVENYSIAGRSVSKIPAKELLQLRGQFRAIVWRQRNPGKLTSSIDVYLPSVETEPYPGGFGYRGLLP
jgi:hypothetical protein